MIAGCGQMAQKSNRPQIMINGIRYKASRIAYFLKHKVDPGEFLVLHTCNTGRCVNWKHLYLGDHSQNQIDRMFDGYVPHKGGAKLTEEMVLEIRNNTFLTREELSIKYGLHLRTIYRILSGDIWKEVQYC